MNLFIKKIHTYKINLILCFIFTFFCSKIQSQQHILPTEILCLIGLYDKHIFCTLREASKKCKKTLDENLESTRLYRWYVSTIPDKRYKHLPLLWAVPFTHMYIVHYLLKMRSIDINAEDFLGMTALSYAVFDDNIELVDLLLKHNEIDVNKGGLGQQISFSVEKLTIFQKRKCLYFSLARTLVFPYYHDYEGNPLMFAINNRNKCIIQLLLNHKGIDVNKCDTAGYFPLFEAILVKDLCLVKLLLKNKCILPRNNSVRNNLIMVAIIEGSFPIFKTLIKYFKIDLREVVDISNRTPLFLAIENKKLNIISWLLQRREIDINKRSGVFDETPLMRAVKMGNKKIVALLLKHKAIDVNKKDSKGYRPLHAAKLLEEGEIRAMLKAKGAVSSEKGRSFFSWFKRKKS